MFTCHPIRNGETYLSKHLTANDYYSENEHVTGTWLGKGSERLGLSGKEIGTKDAAFEALRTNRHPETGAPLTGRDVRDRIAFYDFQCSAPKSVSIAAVTFGDERLTAAHREAVAAAFAELEQYAARRDRAGEKANRNDSRFTSNLVAAAFNHDASRELDAQLHTHLVCANATFDASEGKWYALYNSRMFEAIGFAGRVYQAELAKRVQGLGYAIREDRENGIIKGFEIEGITADDCAKQSTRRAQIEAEIAKFRAEHGRNPTIGETHVIATETRQKKLAEITTPEVRAQQLAKFGEADRVRICAVVERARERAGTFPAIATDVSVAIEGAAEHLLERRAVVTRRDVLTFALQDNLGRVTVDELRGALDRTRDVLPLTVAGDGPEEEVRVTSVAQLARERASVAIVEQGVGRFVPLDRGDAPQGLGEDQAKALREILASRDGVHAMLGRAGAGKTHTLKEFDRCARLAGIVPLYTAPTHAAKEVLHDDGFEGAETVTQLLVNLRAGKSSLSGRMLVVDEAGMLSTKQGEALLQEARRAGARVLLVGDEKQLTSVETGDWLGMLLRHSRLKGSVLSEIRRQQVVEYREAMADMSRGQVAEGIRKLDAQGWVHASKAEYLGKAAEAWLRRTDDKTTAILVAPTWREIDRLNEIVRAELGRRGTLSGPEHRVEVMDLADYTAAQKRSPKSYQPGMFVNPVYHVHGLRRGEWICVTGTDSKTGAIVFANGAKVNPRKFGPMLQIARRIDVGVRVGDTLMLQGNDRKLGVINGERVTVVAIEADGLRVRQNRGRKKGNEVLLPQDYKTFVHGYAVTAEKSQGQTVEHAIVAADRLDGRRTYVATSRGRRSIELHVPDKESVIRRGKLTIEPHEAALDHRPPKGAAQERVQERGALRSFIDRQRDLIKRVAAHVRARFARGRIGPGREQSSSNEL